VVTAVPVGAGGLAAAGLTSTAVALLIVADPDIQAPLPSADLLRETFKLTRAEAEVAVRAARGNDVPTVAASLGISQGTTRLHLHRVFEKVGARRQAELTAVLARLGP
jgi:DNA-binding CsgD family transcriptional regulator